jgi:thiamine biosynthesis lipoprotein
LLQLCFDYHTASEGLFNPALGKLIAAYGFHDGEFDPAAVARIRRDLPDMHDLKIDAGSIQRLSPGSDAICPICMI